jgi:hypothetical protein
VAFRVRKEDATMGGQLREVLGGALKMAAAPAAVGVTAAALEAAGLGQRRNRP